MPAPSSSAATQGRRSRFLPLRQPPSILFATRRSSSSRALSSASVVLSLRADPLVLHRPLPLLLPLPPPHGAQAILPARSSRARPSASVAVSWRAPSRNIIALPARVDCWVGGADRLVFRRLLPLLLPLPLLIVLLAARTCLSSAARSRSYSHSRSLLIVVFALC